MPRRGSPYGPAYQRDRKRLLASHPRCVYCGEPATEADHVPALALHPGGALGHWHGSGCCRLVPACGPCQRTQGAVLQQRSFALRELAERGEEAADMPEPVGFDVLDPVWDVPWLQELLEVPENAVWPRLMTLPHPRAVGSLGGEFEAWVFERSGRRLRWFQRLVVRRLLEVDAAGVLVWDVLILTMARQLGKTWLTRELIMWRLHQGERFGGPQLILHTGMNLRVCRRVIEAEWRWARTQFEFDDDGEPVPLYRTREVNSQEQLERREDGSMWLVVSKTATYGDTSAMALVDEGWAVKAALVDDGLEPTLVEGVQSQLLLVSTAHRLATSLMLGRRAVAAASIDAPGDGDLLIEWSAPRAVDISERSGWRMASPAWSERREKLISKRVADALSGRSHDPTEPDPVESIRAQWLNIWPSRLAVEGRGELLFDTGVWGAIEEDLDTVGPLVFAVEDWMGTGAAAAYAGLAGGKIVCGGYLFDERAAAYRWAAAYSRQRPGSSLLVGLTLRDDGELREFPASVDTRSTTDTRSGLSLLRELVAAGRVVQDGSRDVREQIVPARVTPAPGGGLSLVNAGRLDLVRAVAWVVAEAHRGALVVPQVHGGPL